MMHRWEKLKIDHEKIVAKRAGVGGTTGAAEEVDEGEDEDEDEDKKLRKRAKRTHRKKPAPPVLFPGLQKMKDDVEKAGNAVAKDEEEAAVDEEETAEDREEAKPPQLKVSI
jgi:hypothetical protein